MKKILLALLLCLCAVPAEAAEFKIGVFTLEEVIAKSTAHTEKINKIQVEYAPKQQQLKDLEKEIKERYAQYRNASTTMKPASKSALSAELVRASRDFDTKNSELQNSLYEAEEKAFAEVQALINAAAGNIGKKNGLSLVVDSETLRAYYLAPVADITPAMITEVNRLWKEKSGGK